MKINPIQQNPNFKGYKNLVCDMLESTDNSKFAFMSLQLDNQGCSDLADWQTIQKDLYGIKNPKDVITFQLMKTSRGNNLYFSNKPLTMKITNKSSKEEKLALKAHSLLASLTRRILEQSMTTTDAEMPRVLFETVKNIEAFFFDAVSEVSSIVYNSFAKQTSEHKIAGTINRAIQKNMQAYFKL